MFYIAAMRETDLDEVFSIEQSAQRFPWSYRSFEQGLRHDNIGLCLRDPGGALLGYCVLMPAVDEMHLLNLCVAPIAQGTGRGRVLLEQAVQWSRRMHAGSLLLEVGWSNQRAQRLYRRFGFTVIGCRKSYYPALDGAREDALVMRLVWPLEKNDAAT